MSSGLRCRSARAFTLIELLVSMAVVAVLMLVVLSMSNGTVDVASRAETKVETMSTLRTALDRIAYDLHSALTRDDLPPEFAPSGQDGLEFYSHVPGHDGTRQIARIAYRVTDNGLKRGAEGLAWDGSSAPFSNATATPISPGNYDLLASGVFRMAVGFYLVDGSFRLSPSPTSWSEVRALVICLAMVNADALQRAGWSPEQAAEELPPLFPSPDPQESPITAWSQIADNPVALEARGIPAPVAAGIEIQQRVFPVR